MPVFNPRRNTTFSVTSTGSVDNLDFAGADIVYLDNASDLTITGFLAGFPGQQVRFISRGAGNAFFANQHANSSAVNRCANVVTSGVTPVVSGKGSALYIYDSSAQRWKLARHHMGGWLTPTFNAGDFTGNGSMTWTVASGDVTLDTYTIIDRTMHWNFRYVTTTVGGTPNTDLRKTIPGGYTLATSFLTGNLGVDNGTGIQIGMLYSGGFLVFYRFAGGNWAASTNLTEINGCLALSLT